MKLQTILAAAMLATGLMLVAQPFVQPEATEFSFGKVHGVGTRSGGLSIGGIVRIDGPVDLSSLDATVTISNLFSEIDGAGEVVRGLPAELLPHPSNAASSAIFRTAAGASPFIEMKLRDRGNGEFTVLLNASGTIDPLLLCPLTNINTNFAFIDLESAPAIVEMTGCWRCFKRGPKYEYLRLGTGCGFSPSSPESIRNFFKANTAVDTAAKFFERLDRQFRQHWIMMTNSESLQLGTATSPRIIVPSKDSKRVFAFALQKGPGAAGDPETIEYIQFEDSTSRFRFHSINMQTSPPTVIEDDPTCARCHFGRLGANGRLASGARPNWDTYDSWAGMLPFNRDRIYAFSEEATAVERLLTALRNDPIVRRLELPKGISRSANGETTIAFDRKDDGGTPNPLLVSFFGPPVPVTQGGLYLRLHHSGKGDSTDEGRGVALFDNFTTYNAKRVAQELLDHPPSPVNIHPIALAIAQGNCVTANNHGEFAPPKALAFLSAQHGNKTFLQLRADTETVRKSLPELKAVQQRANLEGLIRARGGNPSDLKYITEQMAQRSSENRFVRDMRTGFMVDREQLFGVPGFFPAHTQTIALFRFFLEPFQVRVDRWSLSVLSRVVTYTFGDQFDQYTAEIAAKLDARLAHLRLPGKARVECPALKKESMRVFGAAFPP